MLQPAGSAAHGECFPEAVAASVEEVVVALADLAVAVSVEAERAEAGSQFENLRIGKFENESENLRLTFFVDIV